MHGPLKMEVRAQFHLCVNITPTGAWFTPADDITARSVSATAAGFSRRRHTRSPEVGNRSGHLQQSRPARLQTVETERGCSPHTFTSSHSAFQGWITVRKRACLTSDRWARKKGAKVSGAGPLGERLPQHSNLSRAAQQCTSEPWRSCDTGAKQHCLTNLQLDKGLREDDRTLL